MILKQEEVPAGTCLCLTVAASTGAARNNGRLHYLLQKLSIWRYQKQLKKLCGLRAFMRELGEDLSINALKVYEDNQGAIALATNPEFHKRTKHIDIRYHFVREKVEDGHVVIKYCPTLDMLADLMTKPIPAVQFGALRSKLGIQASVAVESSESVVKEAPRHTQE